MRPVPGEIAVSLRVSMLIVLLGAHCCCAAGTEPEQALLTLVGDGRARASIVLPDKAVKAEKLAAAELQEHVTLITGIELPVVPEAQLREGAGIYLGATQLAARHNLDARNLNDQEFVIQTVPEGVVILGPDASDDSLFKYRTVDAATGFTSFDTQTWPGWWDAKGTLDAVYDFLCCECGVRWFDFTDCGSDLEPRENLAVTVLTRRRQPSL